MHVSLACIVPDGTVPNDGTLARVAVSAHVYWPIGDTGTVTIEAHGEDGSVYDLTGGTLTMACRRHLSDVVAVFSKTGVVTATPEGGSPLGIATFTLTSADTSSMTAGLPYWFDIRLSKSGSITHILLPSKWIPTATVTTA